MKYALLIGLLWLLIQPEVITAHVHSVHKADDPVSGTAAFAENKGQFMNSRQELASDVLFKASVNGVDIYLMRDGISYVLSKSEKPMHYMVNGSDNTPERMASAVFDVCRVDMKLTNARASSVVEGTEVRGYNNYYSAVAPEGILQVKRYSKVVYKNVYPSIDWVVYIMSGKNGPQLKYDFVVHPGGNPDNISWKYIGADGAFLDNNGLNISTPLGSIIERQPFTYQSFGARVSGTSLAVHPMHVKEIPSSFAVDKNEVRFDIDPYDFDQAVVIDPDVLWSTYYGGSGLDVSYSLGSDADGNTYVGGHTTSIDLPVTPGVVQTVSAGQGDLFVAAFTKSGQLLWNTYYGGSGTETFRDIAVDEAGNIIVVGYTASKNFPTSSNAFQMQYAGGQYDALVLKLKRNGTRLWATYYGGSLTDHCYSVALEDDGSIAVVGGSESSNLPVDDQSFQKTNRGDYDVFVAKLDSNGSRLWSSYIGGRDYDQATGIAIDQQGNVILSGSVTSTDFPVTANAFQRQYGGGERDAVLVKFSKEGQRLWATYYGGSEYDEGFQIATDQFDYLFLGGSTFSTDLSVTSDAFQKNNAGTRDAYVAVFDVDGLMVWATHYGGSDLDGVDDIKVKDNGDVVIAGFTNSADFPVTGDALQTQHAGDYDGFLTVLSSTGALQWSTYFGGQSHDDFVGLDISSEGDLVLSGETKSADLFTTPGSFSENYNGGEWDAFIIRFGVAAGPSVISDVEEDCSSVSFTVTDPLEIQSITLDLQQSDNVSISVRDTLPEGSYRVELRLVDNSREGRFEVDIINSRNQVLSYDGDLYPAAGILQVASPLVEGAVVLGYEVVGNMECGNVMLKNISADTVTIPSLACAINTSFSVPQSQFPLVIPPDSSEPVFVCYVPNDTAVQRDTLIGNMECMSVSVPLVSKGIITSVEYFVEGYCGMQLRLSNTRDAGAQLRAYPAPATDNVVIPVMQQYAGAISAVLYNPLGLSVATGRFEPSNSETQSGRIAGAWIFSVADLPAGMYYAVIPCGQETATIAIPVAR